MRTIITRAKELSVSCVGRKGGGLFIVVYTYYRSLFLMYYLDSLSCVKKPVFSNFNIDMLAPENYSFITIHTALWLFISNYLQCNNHTLLLTLYPANIHLLTLLDC